MGYAMDPIVYGQPERCWGRDWTRYRSSLVESVTMLNSIGKCCRLCCNERSAGGGSLYLLEKLY